MSTDMSEPALIRPATPPELSSVGELTARVYLDEGFVNPDSPYVDQLRDAAGRAARTTLLVAVDPDTEAVLGAVAFAPSDSPYAELAGDGESEFRMLVVDPSARRRGVGTALVRECVEQARAAGCATLRLSTQVEMTTAHRLYERLGFVRTPERDWAPVPGVNLMTYALAVGPVYCDRCGEPVATGEHQRCAHFRDLEPPRWCARCRRRMVVQIMPTGWTARCSEHGTLVSG